MEVFCGLTMSLWNELIFVWFRGDTATLLRLRAVCPQFRDKLNDSHHWDFSTFYRMRCDERLHHWHGVVMGMAREQRTCDNCNAGNYVESVTANKDTGLRTSYVSYIGTRIVTTLEQTFTVAEYDNDTILYEAIGVDTVAGNDTMANRWFIYTVQATNELRMYDCLQLKEVPSFGAIVVNDEERIAVSGLTLAYETTTHTVIVRMNAATGVVRELRRIDRCEIHLHFGLSNQGRFYLTCTPDAKGILVMDCVTGATVRTLSKPRFNIDYFDVIADTYVMASNELDSDDELHDDNGGLMRMIVRSDGVGNAYSLRPDLVFTAARINGEQYLVAQADATMPDRCVIVASSGQRASRYYMWLQVDDSGIFAYCDHDNRVCMLTGETHNERTMLPLVLSQDGHKLMHFRYGVLVYYAPNGGNRMIRFDEPIVTEPAHKKIK